MKTKNLRRLSVLVTPQTLYNLERLAQMGGCASIGRLVDKLTREKMLSLRGDHFRGGTKMAGQREEGWHE